MNPAIERAAIELLEEVLDLPPETRAQLLDSRCRRGEPLRERVEEMLRNASDEDRSFPVLLLGSERQPEPAGGTIPAPGAAFRPGDRLGSYTIEGTLGEGGMGIVYLAEQDSPRRKVALKVLRPRFLQDADFLRRFEREVEWLGRLEHPGIARIYEAGRTLAEVGVPYLAMEYVEGAPLCEFATQELTTVRQKVEFIARIADAVHFAHLKGIVHRDLKPGNVLVDALGQPKVLDFGIATSTRADVDLEQRAEAGQIFGTFAYMSPEQARCDTEAIDARSDVYSLGLIAYELLTGEAAFQAPKSPLSAALGMLDRGEPPLLRSRRPKLGRDLELVIATACREAPSARYQSASAFADDLRRHVDQRPITARDETPSYVLSMFVRRNRALSASLVAVVLVSVAGGMSVTNSLRQVAVHTQEWARYMTGAVRELQLPSVRQLVREYDESLESRYQDLREQYMAQSIQLPKYIAGLGQGGRVYDDVRENAWKQDIQPWVEFWTLVHADQPDKLGVLLQRAADSLVEIGLHGQAVEIQALALECRRKAYGDRDAATLESVAGMAEAWMMGARRVPEYSDLAAEILERAIPIAESVLSENDRLTLQLRNDYAAVLRRRGELGAALDINEDVFQRRWDAFGKDDPQTLNSAINLVLTYLGKGKRDYDDKALTRARETWDVARVALSEEEPKRLAALNAYCVALDRNGRHEDARRLWDELLFEATDIFGPVDPRTLMMRHNIARNRADLGHFDEARGLFEDVATARSKALGDFDLNVMKSWAAVADCERTLGLFDDALPHYQHVYDLYLQAPPATSPKGKRSMLERRLTSMAQLVRARREAGRTAEAESLLAAFWRTDEGEPGSDELKRTIFAAHCAE